MAQDPGYVRLHDRLVNGVVLDINTGWSISGLDVKEFPRDPRAAEFVRGALAAGRLERASRSEFEEVLGVNAEIASFSGVDVVPQEAHVMDRSLELLGALAQSRGFEGVAGSIPVDDIERRKRIIEHQQALAALQAEDEGGTLSVVEPTDDEDSEDAEEAASGAETAENEDDEPETPEEPAAAPAGRRRTSRR